MCGDHASIMHNRLVTVKLLASDRKTSVIIQELTFIPNK